MPYSRIRDRPGGASFNAHGFANGDSDASTWQSVLVVDDETDIRESLKELFDGSLPHVETVTAGSGAAALDALRQPGDLIVTD